MSTISTARSTSRPRLWFGLLGGHLAWTVQLLLSYLLVSLACGVERGGPVVFGLGIVEVLLALVNLGTGVLAIAAAVVAYRAWRHLRGNGQSELGRREDVNAFMALSGLLLSALFVAVIALTAVSFLFLRPCGW